MRASHPLVVGVCVALTPLGCSSPPTQVVVRVATDLPYPAEIDGLSLVLLDGEGREIRREEVPPALLDVLADGAFREVASFGVRPEGGDAGRRFEVVAVAELAGAPRFETRARSGFVRHRTIRLDLYVPSSCVEVAQTCRPDETCGLRGCVDPEVDPEGLPESSDPAPVDAPEDPRPPPPTHALRLLRPLSGAVTTRLAPRLAVVPHPDAEQLQVQLCADVGCRAVQQTLDTGMGGAARPAAPLAPGRYFWRAIARDAAGATLSSRVSWFEVPALTDPRPEPVDDTACGQRLDVTGDGVEDLVVGAPDAEVDGGGRAGRVYVYVGGAGEPDTWERRELLAPEGAFDFGEAVAAAGDTNGDGVGDLIVGAPGGGLGQGRAFVYLGPVGPTTDPIRLSWEPLGAADVPIDRLGVVVGGVGDFDGDGYGDVVVVNQSGADYGWRLFFGSADGPAADSGVGELFSRPGPTTRLALGAGGDLDGDRLDDFVLGEATAASGRGRATAYRGSRDRRAEGLELLLADAEAGAELGAAIAFGNFEGDGSCEVAVSLPGQDMASGAVAHFSVSSDRSDALGLRTTISPGARRGQALSTVDFDDDGLDELIASSLEAAAVARIMSLEPSGGATAIGRVTPGPPVATTLTALRVGAEPRVVVGDTDQPLRVYGPGAPPALVAEVEPVRIGDTPDGFARAIR